MRGPGQDIFPEQAKQQARDIGLESEAAQILKNEPVSDGGADFTEKWVPDGERVDARIDAVGTRTVEKTFGEAVDESTTHVITMEPSAKVTSANRVEIEGRVWTVTGDMVFTDQATVRVQVKELVL
jgi:head-tail adaptor